MKSQQVLHFVASSKSPTLINRQRFPVCNCVIHPDAPIVTTVSISNFQFVNQHPPCRNSTVPTILKTLDRLTKSSRKPTVEQPPASATPSSDQNRAQKPTPWWAIHRRMYDWVLRLAHSNKATLSLFGISFAESSFFPIPPDVMLAPLCLVNRKRWAWFSAVTTIGSVLRALLGYAIGYGVPGHCVDGTRHQPRQDRRACQRIQRTGHYCWHRKNEFFEGGSLWLA